MKNYLLQVKNVLLIPKSYISRQFETNQDSKGHSATSDVVMGGGGKDAIVAATINRHHR
jgi:hypothetical protein